MKSSPASDQSGAIGLFPFLAVLLCTMGSLLVLLVVLAEQAKRSAASQSDAAADAAPNFAATQDDANNNAQALAGRLQNVRKRMEQFDSAARQAEQLFRDEQARLSHLEDHARRLEEELAQLYLAYKQLQAAEQDQVVDQQQAERELARLQQLVEQTQERVEKQRREATGKKSYAIVPYKGKHGTQRRPVYIECTSEGVVIQPEGVVLTEQDFAGPRRPGNPLASAMRAAREHFHSRWAAADGDAPDPYPLLIVRPGGGDYYNAALRAIRDWDAAFGYEFVDAETSLEFPGMDPRLGQSMQHAVEQARQRQRILAEIAPNRYGSLAGQFSPAPASGGSGATGPVGGTAAPDRYGDFASGGHGNPRGGDGASTANGDDELLLSQEPFNASSPTGSDGDPSMSTGRGGGGAAASDSSLAGELGSSAGGTTDLLASMADGSTGAGDESTAGDGEGGGGSGGNQRDAATKRMADDSQSGGSSSGGAAAAGESGSHVSPLGGSAGASQTASGASGQVGDPGGDAGASSPRGIDWSQKMDNREAVAVRRPVRVAVYADRMTLMSGQPSASGSAQPGAVIRLDQPAEKVMNELIAAVRSHMEQWGLAGQGMYWRPELVLEVARGGQSNAEKLELLLRRHNVALRPLESAVKPAEVQSNDTR